MLTNVFYWVFNMSVVASMVGGVVWLIRAIKPIPRRVTVILWGIPLLRMAIPFGVNSPYSLLALVSKLTTNTVVIYQPTDEMAVSVTNCLMAAESYFPMVYKTAALASVFRVASVIWITVAIMLIAAILVMYTLALCGTKNAEHVRRNIYRSDAVVTPSVYGIIQPKILLPTAYASSDLAWILRHERVHIRRADNLWRLLALLTVAVHWFNPLAWAFLSCFYTDLELSCDECVAATLDVDRRKDYARALLNSKQSSVRVTSAFGGANLRVRIEHLLSFKHITWVSGALYALLLVSMAYALLTNAG